MQKYRIKYDYYIIMTLFFPGYDSSEPDCFCTYIDYCNYPCNIVLCVLKEAACDVRPMYFRTIIICGISGQYHKDNQNLWQIVHLYIFHACHLKFLNTIIKVRSYDFMPEGHSIQFFFVVKCTFNIQQGKSFLSCMKVCDEFLKVG